ncbi:MAG: hypothetical protein KKA62_04870 [Nanoarchaeota archaeon]|nr:hypothetical protein [Nanoarchaeota archaeon]MBU1644291.1 hypothetical protein [Nanoarchaeota archaeon]MBU1977253.1 hypothetical protein [Nanoarchaeota archaeon]
MTKEKIAELRETLFNMERKIKPLEWDASRNQINEFKQQQLVKMKAEFITLQEELSKLEE